MLVLNIFFSPYTKRAEGERQWFCLVDYYVPFVGYDAICQMLVVRSIVSVEVIGSKHEYVSIWRRLSIYHLYYPLILTRRTVFISSKFNFMYSLDKRYFMVDLFISWACPELCSIFLMQSCAIPHKRYGVRNTVKRQQWFAKRVYTLFWCMKCERLFRNCSILV